jgi:hypothetical protein
METRHIRPDRQPPPKAITSLLATYNTSHPLRSPSPLPPSSRVDPSKPQRQAPPTSSSPLLWTIPTWFAFLRFALAKGVHIIWSLISHFLWGPARQSWGYRMTFVSDLVSGFWQVVEADMIIDCLIYAKCGSTLVVGRYRTHSPTHLTTHPHSPSSRRRSDANHIRGTSSKWE